MGIYYLNLKHFEKGLQFILESLQQSIAINNDNGMLRCMALFEQFREFSTIDLQQKYRKLVCEVQKLNEEK